MVPRRNSDAASRKCAPTCSIPGLPSRSNRILLGSTRDAPISLSDPLGRAVYGKSADFLAALRAHVRVAHQRRGALDGGAQTGSIAGNGNLAGYARFHEVGGTA